MNPKKYTLNDVREILGAAQNATSGDDKATELVQNYCKYVKKVVDHEHHNINHQITSQSKRYVINLKRKRMISREFDEMVDRRDVLIEINQDLRRQLGLSAQCPNPNLYALDPKTWRNQRVMLDFDEVRAIGGSSRAMDAKDGYPIIDFNQWEDVHEITEKQLQAWKSELVKYLEEVTASGARVEIQLVEEERKSDAVQAGVDEFITNWTSTRDEIGKLKDDILNQEVLKVQVRTLEEANKELEGEVRKQRGGEVAPGLEGEDVAHLLDPDANN